MQAALERYMVISIHAPLAGCDLILKGTSLWEIISIHAPLAGCDPSTKAITYNLMQFQSTHPLRGATLPRLDFLSQAEFQSTHPLRGATAYERAVDRRIPISIHAPLAGCDTSPAQSLGDAWLFQSTHPLRGATAKLPKYSRQICAKATKFLQSRTKSGVAACWAKGRRLLFPTLRGANLPGKTGTLPVRIRQSARPLARNRPWHRSAQRAFHTCCRDNKSAGCLFLCP